MVSAAEAHEDVSDDGSCGVFLQFAQDLEIGLQNMFVREVEYKSVF